MMADQPLKVSIIILTWNGKDLLGPCFEALKKQTYRNFEVIVVDNGSNDGTVTYLKEMDWRALRILDLPENRGFAGGNNEALALATGQVLALLNNDARPEPEWLERGVESIRSGYHMVACKILKADGKTIDKAGHLIYLDGLNRGRGTGQSDGPQFSRQQEVLWPDGCAAFYSRQLVDDIGFFDAKFFLYGEDADLGIRALRAGYRCVYNPESIVIHLQSASLGKFNPKKVFYVERNRIFLLCKNFPISWILMSPWYSLKRFTLNLFSLWTGRGAAAGFKREHSGLKLAGVLIKATLAGLSGAPGMMRKRQFSKNRIQVSVLKSRLKEHRISTRDLTLSD